MGTVMGVFRGMRLWVLCVVIGFGGSATSALSQPPKGNISIGMSGTIGRYPIAVGMTLRDYIQIVAAHYSYASKKVAIPLAGHVDGEQITLNEPEGGVFHLHFITSDASAPKPLNFWTSTGLVGTWTKGNVTLPAKFSFVETGGDTPDCAFYPPVKSVAAPRGTPHFPNPGCTHTPDRTVLDRCIALPFTTNKAVAECVVQATRACSEDQMDMNLCVANVNVYLDETVKQRLRAGDANGHLDAGTYRTWTVARTRSCRANSEFSPDGSGYNADIDFCMSYEMMRLLQTHLVPMPKPFH